MSKRILTMILAAMLLALAFVPAALAVDDTPMQGTGWYYVYTANGKTLNVRSSPNGPVVGHLKYGSKIYVQALTDENWALITYKYNNGYGMGEYAAFVNRRFLTRKNPGAKPSDAKKQSATAAGTLTDLNAEFKTAKRVTPYKVTVRPSRASGWVSMHWAPSKDTEIIATYSANAQLLVIWETANWLQVEDQETGDVGFISRQFVSE